MNPTQETLAAFVIAASLVAFMIVFFVREARR